MIDTGGTLCKAAEALKERGAKRVFAYATHPIFSGNAVENLRKSVLDQVIVCDTIPLSQEIKSLPNVRTLTSFSASAALHSVPPVSIMSSTSTQSRPATSPMMCIT